MINHIQTITTGKVFTLIIQAVLDYKYRFLDLYTGWPGSVHDACVFALSSLYKLGVDNKLLPNTRRVIEGTEVPLYLIGDFAIPLTYMANETICSQ